MCPCVPDATIKNTCLTVYIVLLGFSYRIFESCRKAKVTPVFKMGKKEDSGNYRPVSLTSIHGKVMEQLILDVISKQVEEKKVSRSRHHGFIKEKSCLTHLLAFYDSMTGWVGEGRAVDVFCLHFSKT